MNNALTLNNTLPPLELDSKARYRIKECLCGKSNKDGKFVPYKGYDDAGFCHGCGETFLPKSRKPERTEFIPTPPPEIKTIPYETVAASMNVRGWENNNFVQFLLNKAKQGYFHATDAIQALESYYVGTDKNGHTIFWLLNSECSEAYTGQIIEYSRDGKRSKTNTPPVAWVHTRLNIPNECTLKPLYGLQLLSMQDNYGKPVALVESPKTAIIASLYYGDTMIFLATYGKYGCKLTNRDNCKPLIGKVVTMYPDLKAYSDWIKRAEYLRLNGVENVNVSTLLIDNATESDKAEGDLDLADYLLRFKKHQLRNSIAA